jgi:hypothetical protein
MLRFRLFSIVAALSARIPDVAEAAETHIHAELHPGTITGFWAWVILAVLATAIFLFVRLIVRWFRLIIRVILFEVRRLSGRDRESTTAVVETRREIHPFGASAAAHRGKAVAGAMAQPDISNSASADKAHG